MKSQNGPKQPFSGNVGKLDLDKVKPESLRDLLKFLQENANRALGLEGHNASGGAKHPPYHFDFLEVPGTTVNAHAFQHEGFAFIVMTLPLVELLLNLTFMLSESILVRQLLGVGSAPGNQDPFRLTLFLLQFDFLLGHEYTHHVHHHCAPDESASLSVRRASGRRLEQRLRREGSLRVARDTPRAAQAPRNSGYLLLVGRGFHDRNPPLPNAGCQRHWNCKYRRSEVVAVKAWRCLGFKPTIVQRLASGWCVLFPGP
jgi:hypothetical protein